MLVVFVGTPCSGKTTTAARLFSDLKDAGYPAEFIPETARRYIAERRLSGRSDPLSDVDQGSILYAQAEAEELMYTSSPDSIVVADSATINTLLYMSNPSNEQLKTCRTAAHRYDLVFRCHPVRPGSMYDANRVHSFEESLALDAGVEALLASFCLPFVPLFGPQSMRAQKAYGACLEAMVRDAAKGMKCP